MTFGKGSFSLPGLHEHTLFNRKSNSLYQGKTTYLYVAHSIDVTPEWEETAERLLESGRGVIYVIGATDQGKSTFCRYLRSTLSSRAVTAYLDCDTGQSSIGPPTTVGLGVYTRGKDVPDCVRLRFVGATSPAGHILELLVGSARLLDICRDRGVAFTVIDSPGYVLDPAAQEFHVRMIDIIRPDHIFAIQSGNELEGILVNFSRTPGISIQRFEASKRTVTRKRGWRRIYREKRFIEYFAGSTRSVIPLEGLGVHGRLPETFREDDWKNLICALCDADMMVITLGIIESLDLFTPALTIRAPPFDRARIASLHVGTVRIDPQGRQIRERYRSPPPGAQREALPGETDP
jgi:Predicted GTPase or GTP-binding protein